jgi:hypothetical protein
VVPAPSVVEGRCGIIGDSHLDARGRDSKENCGVATSQVDLKNRPAILKPYVPLPSTLMDERDSTA